MTNHKSLLILALFILSSLACNISADFQSTATPLRPATIQDPLLLEGWTALYQHQEPIRLPDGTTLTGRQLAQFVIDRAIPVQWSPEGDRHELSYSELYCRMGVCTYALDPAVVEPLYITPVIAERETGRLDTLVEMLAHEIYHRLQPFGQVRPTLFEEYSAYYLGQQVSGVSWAAFSGYDAKDPVSLARWFSDHKLADAYRHLDPYPQMVLEVIQPVAVR